MTATKTGSKKRGDANGNRLVISYLRFSRPEQLKGDSVRRQLEASKKWASERQLSIDESLTDYGISAYRGANADGDSALGSFLRLCELGQIPQGSILLVESLDRLSRNELLEALELFLSIIRRGIKIVTLMDGQEYSRESLNQNMMGLQYSIMQMSLAHEESAKKAFRVSKAWAEKRRNMDRKPLTGKLPAWLKLVDNKIVVDPAKAAVVKRMFKMVRDGHGLHAITKTLNRDAQPIGRVKRFQRSYVFKILHNRSVFGEFQPHKIVHENRKKRREPVGDPIKNYFPGIISETEFYAAQNALKARQTMRGPTSKFINLFTGMLYCMEDESPLQVVNKGNGRCYCSSAAMLGLKGAASAIRFPVRVFEAAMLAKIAQPELYRRNDLQLQSVQMDLSASTGQLAEVEGRITAIQEAMVKAGGNAASVVKMLGQLDSRRAELVAAIGQLKGRLEGLGQGGATTDLVKMVVNKIRSCASQKGKKWDFSVEQRKQLRAGLRRLVQRIDCHFVREGRDYIAATKTTLQNGVEFDTTFRANHLSQMLRDKKGHPVRHERKAPETAYELDMLVEFPEGFQPA